MMECIAKCAMTASLSLLVLAAVGTGAPEAQTRKTVPLPAGTAAYSPGANYDKMSWEAFVAAVAPTQHEGSVVFETWASDPDTFTESPKWPDPNSPDHNHQKRFGYSRLAYPHGSASIAGVCTQPSSSAAAASNFPLPATTPSDCISEEVRRNRASFDYIIGNGLFTRIGLQTAFAGPPINFPKDAVELKADWIPVETLRQWLSRNDKEPWKEGQFDKWVDDNYYTTTPKPGNTEYALLSMHISTKQLPNWLWATFEHQLNPGRCDTMGCYDEFGMKSDKTILPRQAPAPNSRQNFYPDCKKSDALRKIFKDAKLTKVWNKYCLKATQIDFLSTQNETVGLDVLNGDSVIERLLTNVPIKYSSCITCHAYAAFDEKGCVDLATNPGLSNPAPIGLVDWDYFQKADEPQKQFDFVWGLLTLAPCKKN